jgi:UDP-glucose 4-epimerase
VKRLLALAFEVTLLDDFSTGRKESLGANGQMKVRMIRGDICDPTAVANAVKGADMVFHLAAKSSVEWCNVHPEETWKVNVDGTKMLLDAAAEAGCKSFVFASSAAVYGNPVRLPVTESSPLVPISSYGKSKLAAERLCIDSRRQPALATCVLRLFNVYGEGSEKGDVISAVSAKLGCGQRPVVYGDGTQTRDFVNVEDVVSAMISGATNPLAAGHAINVCTGIPTSVIEVINLLTMALDRSHLTPDYQPQRTADIRHSYGNPTLAKALLGFVPEVTLDRGLGAMGRRGNQIFARPSF